MTNSYNALLHFIFAIRIARILYTKFILYFHNTYYRRSVTIYHAIINAHSQKKQKSQINKRKMINKKLHTKTSNLRLVRYAKTIDTHQNLSRIPTYTITSDTYQLLTTLNAKSYPVLPNVETQIIEILIIIIIKSIKKIAINFIKLYKIKKKLGIKIKESDIKIMKKNIYQNENNEEVNNLLCDAVIKFDFIRVKVNSSVILNFSSSVAGSVVFILYNYSRLNAIILEFESRVLKNYYPPLPLAEFVDFSVLKLEKEWNLMFHFVLNFPNVIRNTMEYIEEGKPSPHLLCTFLYSLARTVSSYYRSTKILLDGKSHLLPIIYARLYLLKAVHLILSTGLKLLNIEVIPAL
ncbi:hypothetical protein PGB90_003695 [Kerria lacca]